MLVLSYAIVKIFVQIFKNQKFVNTITMMTYTIETPQYTNPQTQPADLDEIITTALQEEYVLGARAFEYNGTVVVAALTTPFVLKSERDGAKAQLSEDLQAAFLAQNIILTFDMQVYRNILDNLDDAAKQELLELAKSR
ncbi:MAG: hypothetical protein NC037_00815 [Bacteroides sp.]|nr:hypothetical protein [Bacillota bacterium]MCM1393440.1 hypothetical protein [[Eubacterium] siraeum]MCM1455060.1 hypothetical protein [Bacteroides sp.]